MILVCFAVSQEAQPFLKLSRGHSDIRVLVHGMGKAATEKRIAALFQQHSPRLVLTCGFAGGLDPSLKMGNILSACDPGFPLQERLRSAGARPGKFHCAPAVLSTAVAKGQARIQTGADAVEMESECVREFCQSKGVPAATVRVILDEAGQDLPFDFNSVMTPDQKINPIKLASAILKNPPLAGTLWHLGRNSRKCAETLAEVLWSAVKPGSQISS